MRIAFAAIPILLLGACQVSKDENNSTTSLTYNGAVAENALSDVGNVAENAVSDIGNDVKNTSEKVQNKVANTDLDVKVNTDVKTENKSK